MFDESDLPDGRTELAVVLGDARSVLKAIQKRHGVRDGEQWMDVAADRLQETLCRLFGDAMPAPIPCRNRTAVVAPKHDRRRHRNGRVAVMAA